MPLSADNWRSDFALILYSYFTQTGIILLPFLFSSETKHNIAVNTCDTLNKNPEVFKTKTFCRDIKSMQMNHKGVDFGGVKGVASIQIQSAI